MRVDAIWRYPVKSLRGEMLTTATLTPDGVQGDRLLHVRRPAGVLTGRTRHALLALPASLGPAGEPLVAGLPWRSPETAERIRAAAGPDAELAEYAGPERFDIANLLVVTDDELAAYAERSGSALDVRRLRPNLVLSGVPRGDTPDLAGHGLLVGDALIGLHSPRPRCIATSIDPETGDQDLDVYRRIRRSMDNLMGINAWVVRPGEIRVGDEARIVELDAEPHDLGGWVVGRPYRVA